MGKLNTYKDIEVIPLESRPAKKNIVANPLKMSRNAYFSDPSIIPKVQKYLEANLSSAFIDINMMAEDLQKKYAKEYGKRKRSAFKAMVKKAYNSIMASYGVNNRNDSSSEELSEESAVDDNMPFGENALSNQLLEMYGRNIAPKPMEDNELIDISSDDSNDQPAKSTNGPSTSQKDLPEYFLEYNAPEKTLPPAIQPPLKNNKPPPLLQAPTTNVPPMEKGARKRKTENSMQSLSKRKKTSVANIEEPSVSFKDVGGMEKVLMEVCKLLVHIKHPEIYKQIGVSPPRGFLLHGPPGCGKTLLANAIAGELEVPLLKVSAPELVAGVSGESEERIRELFERATLYSPCILFIDEIDAITPNRQYAQKEMERRIVAQMLTCLDDLSKNENGDQVLVIGATNRPDSLDPALRRAGRFDREVCLGIPDVQARMDILKVLTCKLKLQENFDYETLAKLTPGFVGADLMSLTREAAMAAVNRVFNDVKEKLKIERVVALRKLEEKQKDAEVVEKPKESENDDSEAQVIVDGEEAKPESSEEPIVVIDDEKQEKQPSQSNAVNSTQIAETLRNMTPLEELISFLHNECPLNKEELQGVYITSEDFGKALKSVQPSAKREGFATVPDVTWDDIGSLRDIREELQMAILAPIRHSVQFMALGLNTPTGVLLCGPPGCGKTLLAKAIANEAGINFISVKGPELLNMYVGESERAVRLCFERARNSAPCVIFFDELDALCPKRNDSKEGGSTMRVVNQMLTEMDGVQARNGVYLLAASNRPDIIDAAVLRPGRLDKILYVGLPSSTDRVDILRTITKNGTRPMLAPDVDLEEIGKSERCDGYTGADLAALVREAGIQALREVMMQGEMTQAIVVKMDHFTKAVAKIRPSVTEKDQAHYAKLKKIYSAKQPDVEEMEYTEIQTH